MKHLLRSLSFRLAILYTGLFCISVCLLMGMAYWVRVVRPMESAHRQVETEAARFQALYLGSGAATLKRALEVRAHRSGGSKPFHAFIAPDGQVMTANLPTWPRIAPRPYYLIEADTAFDGYETDYNALLNDHRFADGSRLLIGRDVDDLTEEAQLLPGAAMWIFGGTLLLGLSGGWLMSRAIGARLEVVSHAARNVMNGDLSGRVPVRGTNDDFDRLSETLNLMLSRIETLFDTARRLSDNAAHELRTPLARLVGRLEALEQEAGSNVALQIAVDEAIVEANRLRSIVSALLRISRLEGGRQVLNLQRSDVVQMLEDAVELYQPEAERRGISLSLHASRPLIADLDLDLVFQALSNLLDNALKYAGSGARVEVSAYRERNALHIVVSDDGPGLSAEDTARVTQQFYRASTATDGSGEGLGLTMVAAIAQAHGAEMALTANTPGLRVGMKFPLAAMERGA